MFGPRDIFTVDIPGLGDAHFDPLALRRVMLAHTHGRCWEYAADAAKIEADLTGLETAEDNEQTRALRAELSMRLANLEGELANAAFAAFGFEKTVDVNDGTGTTEAAALQVMRAYLRWVAEKKEQAGNSPTS